MLDSDSGRREIRRLCYFAVHHWAVEDGADMEPESIAGIIIDAIEVTCAELAKQPRATALPAKPASKFKITPHLADEIRRRHREGESAESIAKSYGVYAIAIYRTINAPVNSPPTPHEEVRGPSQP